MSSDLLPSFKKVATDTIRTMAEASVTAALEVASPFLRRLENLMAVGSAVHDCRQTNGITMFEYTNHRGVRETRFVGGLTDLRYGVTMVHGDDPHWIVDGFCVDRCAIRTFKAEEMDNLRYMTKAAYEAMQKQASTESIEQK